ncbi:MAG TPA: hypothetical protein VG826_15705 [Pirellulales bacterium]|nr:hypothetical protein [Pirellulales bacterium]
MAKPSYSLRWLLGSITFLAIGCGLLIYAREVTASITFAATLLVLFAAIPLSVYRGGRPRAFWFGFALFGLSYLALVCGPWEAPDAYLHVRLRDRLPTMKLLELAHRHLPTKPVIVPANGMGGGMFGQMGMGGMGTGGPITATAPISEWSDFAVVGHSLWTIFIAVLGGGIAAWCQRSSRRETARGGTREASPTDGRRTRSEDDGPCGQP